MNKKVSFFVINLSNETMLKTKPIPFHSVWSGDSSINVIVHQRTRPMVRPTDPHNSKWNAAVKKNGDEL